MHATNDYVTCTNNTTVTETDTDELCIDSQQLQMTWQTTGITQRMMVCHLVQYETFINIIQQY